MIREYTETDLDAIMRLWLEINIETHSFIPPSYWKDHYDTVKQLLPSSTVYVYGHTIQGFIGLQDSYIAGIFVGKQSQSKGIGKALLNYAKDRNDMLTLHVYKKNARAIQFYLKEGFTVLREQIDENTEEEELVMIWVG